MPFERGDIVKVYFKLPDAKNEDSHPAIIISNNGLLLDDECYICVMITGSDVDDIYSFPIEDSMLNKPLQKKSQVRIHLITHVMASLIDLKSPYAKMKEGYVNKLCAKIHDIVFCPDEE